MARHASLHQFGAIGGHTQRPSGILGIRPDGSSHVAPISGTM